RLQRRRSDGEPTRRCVLDDRARHLTRKGIGGQERAFQVQQVVEGEFLAAKLLQLRESAAPLLVEGRLLPGILAVAKCLPPLERDGQSLRKHSCLTGLEPCRNRCV